jgi:hypothetical protein
MSAGNEIQGGVARLDYSALRRSSRLPGLLTMVALAGSAAFAYLYGWPRVKAWNARREDYKVVQQCEDYQLSGDTLMYEPDRGRAAELIASGAFHVVATNVGDALRVVPPWQALSRRLGLIAENGAVFCHRVTSPAGHQRLVVVARVGKTASGYVIDPGSPSVPPRVVGRGLGTNYLLLRRGAPSVRLFAGQPDARDRSHFSIRYADGRRDGIIDGWLLDDDRVRIRVLTGPYSRPLSYFQDEEEEADATAANRPPPDSRTAE